MHNIYTIQFFCLKSYYRSTIDHVILKSFYLIFIFKFTRYQIFKMFLLFPALLNINCISNHFHFAVKAGFLELDMRYWINNSTKGRSISKLFQNFFSFITKRPPSESLCPLMYFVVNITISDKDNIFIVSKTCK